ncbi:transposase [Achromobacter sp. PD1]|uniref:transposase n=1 Tax=Achromobacter sp. PD1 TaxID=3399125 RepID=UPI003AF500FD
MSQSDCATAYAVLGLNGIGFISEYGKVLNMERSGFSEEQIRHALKQATLGTPMSDICKRMGVSEAIFHAWKVHYDGLASYEMKLLNRLENECNRLERLIAILALNKVILQDTLGAKE